MRPVPKPHPACRRRPPSSTRILCQENRPFANRLFTRTARAGGETWSFVLGHWSLVICHLPGNGSSRACPPGLSGGFAISDSPIPAVSGSLFPVPRSRFPNPGRFRFPVPCSPFPAFGSYPQRHMSIRPCTKPSNPGQNRSKRGQNRVKKASKTIANRHAHLNILGGHPLWR